MKYLQYKEKKAEYSRLLKNGPLGHRHGGHRQHSKHHHAYGTSTAATYGPAAEDYYTYSDRPDYSSRTTRDRGNHHGHHHQHPGLRAQVHGDTAYYRQSPAIGARPPPMGYPTDLQVYERAPRRHGAGVGLGRYGRQNQTDRYGTPMGGFREPTRYYGEREYADLEAGEFRA